MRMLDDGASVKEVAAEFAVNLPYSLIQKENHRVQFIGQRACHKMTNLRSRDMITSGEKPIFTFLVT